MWNAADREKCGFGTFKNENSVVIYQPSGYSKPVKIAFFVMNQIDLIPHLLP